jgi:hypothetical protein
MAYLIRRHGKAWQVRRLNFDGSSTFITEKRSLGKARVLAGLLAGWNGRVIVHRTRS